MSGESPPPDNDPSKSDGVPEEITPRISKRDAIPKLTSRETDEIEEREIDSKFLHQQTAREHRIAEQAREEELQKKAVADALIKQMQERYGKKNAHEHGEEHEIKEWEGLFYICDSAGRRLSTGYDSISWSESVDENGARTRDFLVGRKNGMEHLLDLASGKQVSLPYTRIERRDRRIVVGMRAGKEFLLNLNTGKEISADYDRIGRSRTGQIVGMRGDHNKEYILEEKGEKSSGQKKQH
jgi:hypothetical protein